MKTLELDDLKASVKCFIQSNRKYSIVDRCSGCRSYRNLSVFFYILLLFQSHLVDFYFTPKTIE